MGLDINYSLNGLPSLETLPNQLFLRENCLRAEKVQNRDYSVVGKTISAWAETARNKASLAAAASEKGQFTACASISECIASSLYYRDRDEQIYVCKDFEGTIQAAMVTTIHTNYVYIEFLATNPINIRSSVNAHESKKIAGAGTCLLKKAEKVAIEKGKGSVQLTPLSTAVEFYKKNGFSFRGGSMHKTVHKIHDDVAIPYFDVA